MSTRALTSVGFLGVVASIFAGCGDGDGTALEICRSGAVQCLSDKSGLVCASDGTANYPFECDDGQVCATDASGKTGCVGGCEPGETECASEAISRVCSDDGKTWLPVACEPGTGCDGNPETDDAEPNPDYGTCVRSDDPTVAVCTPKQTTCADGQTVKACEIDGSSWVYTACAENEACDDGECVVDPDKRCTPNTGICVDATHVKKCGDDGTSYDEPETCPGTSTCSDGACRGPVCTVDEVRCDDVRDGNVWNALSDGSYQPRALYTCEGGERWDVTACAQTAVCAYTDISATAVNQYVEDLKSALENQANLPVFDIPESSRATCQTPECGAPFALRELMGGSFLEELAFGSYTCGDAKGDDPSDTSSFSLCEGLPPYNNLHWANYSCPVNTECSYVETVSQPGGPSQAPVCQANCTEGDVRCYDALGESTITCHDGQWDLGSVTRCVDGGREQWCRRNPTAGGTNFTQATCQDPACVVWQDEFETFLIPDDYGACGDDGRFYQCMPDGRLQRGNACPNCVRSSIRAPGIEPPSREPSHFAGYQPGYCLEECVDDEEMCVDIESSTPSPFYYQCDRGHWTTVASCSDGKACRDIVRQGDPLPPRRIICGGLCDPGTTECVDEEGSVGVYLLTTCTGAGEWGEPVACERGVCTKDDQQSPGLPGRAACEDECIPATKSCRGTLSDVTCTSAARYGDPEACASNTACVAESASLARLGCIECAPRDPTNPEQIPDSRCAGSQLELCGPDGRWASSVATSCPGGCSGSQAGSTTPGGARAQCLPLTGTGGQAGSGPSAGSGGLGRAGGGAGGAASVSGAAGSFNAGGFGGIDR